MLEAFLAKLAHVLRTAHGQVHAVIDQHAKTRERTHRARLRAGRDRLAADQPLHPQLAHVVVVVGIVQGVFEVGFLGIDRDDVSPFVSPQIEPGVIFAVVEHVAFLPDESGDFLQQLQVHKVLHTQADIIFFHCW
ncbi:hypothetical protein D3C76_1346520 [compost metagenome]